MKNNESASFLAYQIDENENVRNMTQPFITITHFGNNIHTLWGLGDCGIITFLIALF